MQRLPFWKKTPTDGRLPVGAAAATAPGAPGQQPLTTPPRPATSLANLRLPGWQRNV